MGIEFWTGGVKKLCQVVRCVSNVLVVLVVCPAPVRTLTRRQIKFVTSIRQIKLFVRTVRKGSILFRGRASVVKVVIMTVTFTSMMTMLTICLNEPMKKPCTGLLGSPLV